MSHEEFIRNQREMYYDRTHDANLQQVAEGAAAAETAGALGGELGGDLGAELGGGMEEPGLGAPEEMPAGEAGAEPPPPEEESPLLAVPPGSRDSPRLTPGARGKVYHPVKTDKRQAGARSRSYAAKHSKEKSSSGIRNVMPGYSDLRSMVKMDGLTAGIYEQDASIYNLREHTEEERLFKVNDSLGNLITELEKKESLLMEQKDET